MTSFDSNRRYHKYRKGEKALGRKNKRKKECYEHSLGFNPKKYISKNVDKNIKKNSGGHVYDGHVYDGHVSGSSQSKRSARNTDNIQPKHYDVWFADLGIHPGTSVQGGCRPVVIISNDRSNAYASTVTVLPMTSKRKRLDMASHAWLEGISEEVPMGMLLAEQITTIPKSALRRCVGTISEQEHIEKLERAVRAQFDMSAVCNSSDHTNNDHTNNDHGNTNNNDNNDNTHENNNDEKAGDGLWQQQ